MIKEIFTKRGNLLHVTKGHIVHGCNAQGVMGSGVALGVKETWPHVFQDYRETFEKGELKLGTVHPVLATPTIVVWNAITQDLFGTNRRQTSYEAIATCFETINDFLHNHNSDLGDQIPNEVHIPLIGAGRGGGNWNIISTIIVETMDFPVTLWLPDSTVTTL